MQNMINVFFQFQDSKSKSLLWHSFAKIQEADAVHQLPKPETGAKDSLGFMRIRIGIRYGMMEDKVDMELSIQGDRLKIFDYLLDWSLTGVAAATGQYEIAMSVGYVRLLPCTVQY